MPRRFTVRRSPVHGRGLFALTVIAAGEDIIRYRGELIGWAEAQARYEAAGGGGGHTFFFEVDADSVIDGGAGGNSSRWLNHGCDPNCEAVQDADRIVVTAVRAIGAGEELLIDYRLQVDERPTAALRALYACRCGAPSCRGTMLEPTPR